MHLGRFHVAVTVLDSYYSDNAILKSLDSVIAALNTHISTPNPENAKLFRARIDEFHKVALTRDAETNYPTFQAVLSDLNGKGFFGEELVRQVTSAVSERGLIPQEALQELNALRKKLAAFIESVGKASSSLGQLNAEITYPSDGEFELGILLPKDKVGLSVTELGEELQHINRLFKVLSEIVSQQAQSPQIKSLSTSCYEFFLLLDPVQISAVTFAIERIVNLYKTNLEIQKLRQAAHENDLGPEITAAIDKKIDERVRLGIAQIATKLREQYQKNKDDGRVNELETQLRIELFHLAKRINQGAAFEVRAGIPDVPKDPPGAKEDPELARQHEEKLSAYAKAKEQADTVNAIGQNIARRSKPSTNSSRC